LCVPNNTQIIAQNFLCKQQNTFDRQINSIRDLDGNLFTFLAKI